MSRKTEKSTKTKAPKKTKETGKKPFKTLKAKLILMAGVSAITTVILGVTGISSMNKNNDNTQLTSDINNIHLLQNENKTLDVSFLYELDNSYNDQQLENLKKMQEYSQNAAKYKNSSYASAIDTISQDIQKTLDNMNTLVPLMEERGFSKDVGSYAKYMEGDTTLEEFLGRLGEEADWQDGKWDKLQMADLPEKTVDGKKYRYLQFSGGVPNSNKRDMLAIRLGNNGGELKGNVYITNIMFDGKDKVDISALTASDLSDSYGEAFKDLEVSKIGDEPALHYQAAFQAGTEWQEASIELPVKQFPLNEYKKISFECYIEDTQQPEIQVTASTCGSYEFDKALDQVNDDFASYSNTIAEGNDASEIAEKLEKELKEAIDSSSAYISSEEIQQLGIKGFQAKLDAFQAVQESDAQIQQLKVENNSLNENLTSAMESVKGSIEKDMDTTKSGMITMIVTVIVIGILLIAGLNTYLIRSVEHSINGFRGALEKIADGHVTVKAKTGTGDEFDAFGHSLNNMTDKLTSTVTAVNMVAGQLKDSGADLKDMAENTSQISSQMDVSINEIATGASSQADDVEESTTQIQNLGNLMDHMVSSVTELDHTSVDMKNASVEAVNILERLSDSNGKMTDEIGKIAQQIYETNDSVQKIKEAVSLISSIADQTNLLSLNASIEAARAGEAGRGFAVVATEISQLADQSNQSAATIDEVINKLATDFQNTMDVMKEVESATADQNKKLSDTQEQFEIVSQGISQSRNETAGIKKAIEECNNVRLNVSQIMMNLSAISQENVAATGETAGAMEHLNSTMQSLLQESDKLLDISSKLEEDLNFFKLNS